MVAARQQRHLQRVGPPYIECAFIYLSSGDVVIVSMFVWRERSLTFSAPPLPKIQFNGYKKRGRGREHEQEPNLIDRKKLFDCHLMKINLSNQFCF